MPVLFAGDDELPMMRDEPPMNRFPPQPRRWSYEESEPTLVNTEAHPASVLLPDGTWLQCRSMVDARAVAAVIRLLVVEQVDRQPSQKP